MIPAVSMRTHTLPLLQDSLTIDLSFERCMASAMVEQEREELVNGTAIEA
jgi:hypothetical protein